MGESIIQTRFDGIAIDFYGGRFNGTFDVEAGDSSEIRLDSEVYFVVRTRVVGAAISETKSGDLKRVNIYSVTDATQIPPAVGFKLQTVGHAQLSFETDLLEGLVDDPEDEVV